MAVPSGTLTASARHGYTLLDPATDLTWVGQAKVPPTGSANYPNGGTSYARPPLAVRYVDGTRYVYLVNYAATSGAAYGYVRAGDLVEWSVPALVQGAVASANSLTISRTWENWIAYDQMVPLALSTGVEVDGIWFDTREGYENVIWYVMHAYYASGNMPFLGATTLNDDGSVDRHGLWYWQDAGAYQYWKAVGGWVFAVPEYAQSALGKMGVGAGAVGTVGASGNFGPGLRTVAEFPSLDDEAGSVVGATNQHIVDYSTSYETGTYAPMHRTTNYTLVNGNHPAAGYARTIGGSTTYYAGFNPGSFDFGVPAAEGDRLYIHSPSQEKSLAYSIFMDTPTVGGTKVLKYYNGSAWVALSGQTANAGSINLTSATNHLTWTVPSDWALTTLGGSAQCYFLCIENVTSSSTGGTMSAGRQNQTHVNAGFTDDEVSVIDGVGYMQATRDNVQTFTWVYTSTGKHGVLCFGRKVVGNTWYGPYPMYSSDKLSVPNGPASIYCVGLDGATGGNGYHADAMQACIWLHDPSEFLEVANGTRYGNANGSGALPGINASGDWDWYDLFPLIPSVPIITGATATNWTNAQTGNGGYWDAVAQQFIWHHCGSWTSGYSSLGTIQVFDVA